MWGRRRRAHGQRCCDRALARDYPPTGVAAMDAARSQTRGDGQRVHSCSHLCLNLKHAMSVFESNWPLLGARNCPSRMGNGAGEITRRACSVSNILRIEFAKKRKLFPGATPQMLRIARSTYGAFWRNCGLCGRFETFSLQGDSRKRSSGLRCVSL